MPTQNPYTPPSTPIETASPSAATRTRFPWLMVLRWLVGLGTLITGLYGLYTLIASWELMTDQAIIDINVSPFRFLPFVLFKIAAGIAILLRSKWAIALILAWSAAFAYRVLMASQHTGMPSWFLHTLLEQLAILAFMCLLWFRGRLR